MISTKAFAAQHAASPLTPFSFERREPGVHDVAIEISHCGVCHTDIHFVRNDWGMSLYPMVPGHEIVGKVVAVGGSVTKFRPGDTVGVGCLVDSCRECESCANGLEQHCQNGFVLTYSGYEKDGKTITQGGYSTKIVVEERFVLKVSPSLAAEGAAPLLCAGITTYSPLRRWKIGKGHKVAIVGLGGLGHMGVKFAASFGAEVTVLSTSASKKSDSQRLGAHDFVLTTDDAQVKRSANQFDFILDTLSASHDYNAYVGMLKTGGTMACVGLPPEPIQIPALNIVFTRKCIAGSLIGGLPETQEMLDYCAAHDITADVEVIPIQQINDAYSRMLKNDVKYRFVIDTASLK
jgi:alcohol dehydrogenase (NADP+)